MLPGEAVTIGSTVLMVQETRTFARPRRVWPHTYFEARVEEEVVRARDTQIMISPCCSSSSRT